MESVVAVIRGSALDPNKQCCQFCGTDQSVSLFCITKEKKYDGILLQCFGVCKEHLDRLNALLSGEFDIDDIYLEKYRVRHSKNLQLRN